MSAKQQSMRDRVLAAALPSVPFDGWTHATLARGAAEAGYGGDMADALFPEGVIDALDHFADYADRAMLTMLEKKNAHDMRVRDRIKTAVLARLHFLTPHREAERAALAWWSIPGRQIRGGKILWRTADRIWTWAGDTSADYNHYTKRVLLGGVIGSTTLAWLGDESENEAAVEAFLDRRIENVLQWGRLFGKFKKTG